MSYTVGELIGELVAILNNGDADPASNCMLNVDGRWTAVKGMSVQAGGLVLLESED